MTFRFDIKNLFQILALCIVGYIVYASFQVILIAIFGMLLAFMLNPLAEKMVSIKIPRPLAVLMLVIVVGGSFFLIMLWLVPQIYNDINKFTSNLPVYITWVMDRLLVIGAKLDMDLSATALYSYMTNWLKASGTHILKWMGGVAGSVQYAIAVGANIVLVPVITFFALLEYPDIAEFIKKYGGDKDHGVRKYIIMFSSVMSSYFRGQFTVVAILCVLYSVALKIVGLDSAILLGITSGLLSIVPYMGFAVGIVASVVMAAIQFQDIWHPLYVVIGYAVVQALESFVITPRVMGVSLGLNPVATIIVLLIGGAVFGIVGMIFALPLAAVLFKIYKEHVAGKETDVPADIELSGDKTDKDKKDE